jgi:hypothetical protein
LDAFDILINEESFDVLDYVTSATTVDEFMSYLSLLNLDDSTK